MTPAQTLWLDSWRHAHRTLAELRDAETEEAVEAAHRRATCALDHAILDAYSRGLAQGKERAAAADPTADRAQIASLGARR